LSNISFKRELSTRGSTQLEAKSCKKDIITVPVAKLVMKVKYFNNLKYNSLQIKMSTTFKTKLAFFRK
jgi:hypothetical protein